MNWWCDCDSRWTELMCPLVKIPHFCCGSGRSKHSMGTVGEMISWSLCVLVYHSSMSPVRLTISWFVGSLCGVVFQGGCGGKCKFLYSSQCFTLCYTLHPGRSVQLNTVREGFSHTNKCVDIVHKCSSLSMAG